MSHFIDARFWLDSDGKHVWLRHQCNPRINTTMLPWPTWQATADGRVEPSVICQDCDLHVVGGLIEEPPGIGDWSLPPDPFTTPAEEGDSRG